MKKITAKITDGQILLDFDGFMGNACSDEEDLVRTLYAKMGVETDVKSDNKKESETETIAERERE